MMKGITVSALCLLASGATAQMPAPRGVNVKMESGIVAGVLSADGKVTSFRGIPFAAPPVDSLRWRAPRPAAAWTGIRQAGAFGPSCMQGPNTPFGPWTTEFLFVTPVSEDCLYLNVWTAAKPTEKRPVLVYVYGGGFNSGSGDVPVYEGSKLAAKGLVVVTFNYRVGPLGFLAHPALTAESSNHASGNYGLLDQVAALQWVRTNIAAFGGDPGRVTVSGQSAGAMSVALLTVSPLARGLFHRAIVESGPGGLASMGVAGARGLARPLADAERDGVAFATAKGASSLAALRALPASSLARVAGRFGPDVDGYFLPDDMATLVAAGKVNDVPMLTGLNADEGSASPTYGHMTAEQFRQQATQRYGDRANAFLARFPATSESDASRSQVVSARDAGIAGVQQLLTERARTAHTPSFAYYFNRAIPWPAHPEFGAFHSSEVPYVFGTLDALARPWTDYDRRLSEAMMGYWVNFATRGDPNGPDLQQWPAYQPSKPNFMELGLKVGVMRSLEPAVLELFAR
jgi:para-nitrobenzyl esterase